jgi:signal transduction histidine kinase
MQQEDNPRLSVSHLSHSKIFAPVTLKILKPSNKQIGVKALYVCVALFVLAALVLQVLSNMGRLPTTLPPALPTVISVAALVVALGVLVRRLWIIDRLLTREFPQGTPSLFPDHPMHEVMQMHEAETERAVKISSLSHELRTPLTSINGFSELLMQDESVSGEAREFAAFIHTEAQRLTSMVNNVLTEAQLSAGIVTSDE